MHNMLLQPTIENAAICDGDASSSRRATTKQMRAELNFRHLVSADDGATLTVALQRFDAIRQRLRRYVGKLFSENAWHEMDREIHTTFFPRFLAGFPSKDGDFQKVTCKGPIVAASAQQPLCRCGPNGSPMNLPVKEYVWGNRFGFCC